VQLHALTRGAALVALLASACSITLANAAPRANVVTRAWKADLVPEEEPQAKIALPSRVSFNAPELHALRTAAPDMAGDLRDRVNVGAPRMLELQRLAAIGRRPLYQRWRPGSSPFDFMTAPAHATTVLPSVYVADPERWAAVLEAAQTGGACACLAGAGPGRVPNGDDLPGAPLRLGRNAGVPTNIDMTWSASCSPDVTDYAIYQGSIGTWNVHTPQVCSTGAALAATITPQAGSRYYLVVPLNARSDGSYGVDSDGVDRPPSGSPCRPAFIPDTCP
jgi:hypothetical protein